MKKEVDQFMFRIVDAVEKVLGRFPLEHPYLSRYARDLGRSSGGEAEYVFLNRVPRRVFDDVKERMNESDLRQAVHYFRIRFCDLPCYVFWVVVFGMKHNLRSYFPVILAYKHSTLIDGFCGRFLL
jgi:hypothetical protein